MAGATTTTLSNFVSDVFFQEGITKTFFDSTPLISMFGTKPASKPGDSVDWTVNSSGHTAVNYSEGHTPPVAGYNTFVNLTMSYKYAWDTIQVTGHAIDALKGGRIDPVMTEIDAAVRAVAYKQEQNMAASLLAAIDDSTNYASANRSTYNLLSLVVAGGSAAVTLAKLSELYEGLKLLARAKPETEGDLIILSSIEQLIAYTELTGVQYKEHQTFAADTRFDLGRIKPSMTYNGIPWYVVPTLTNTVIYLTRKSDVEIIEKRAIKVEPLAKVDDSDKLLVTSAMELIHHDPYRAGKIEALTT